MQIKKKKNQCGETRGIFRCEMQSGHISERHQHGDVSWHKCRECGRNHSSIDHERIEERVRHEMAKMRVR
jgi:ribosomal protein L34E